MGLRRLVECAVLIAIGTVLSLFEFSGPWALGGGITVCSMLPLVLICHRHGTKWSSAPPWSTACCRCSSA